MGKVIDQQITDRWAIYNGDCLDVMRDLPDGSIHLSVYSPPFATDDGGALYHYSSSPRDLSNSRTYKEFFEHYEFVVRELHRLTMPGRISAVHCMDVPTGNTGCDALVDFPGDIIRLHERCGFRYIARHAIWKEPLTVRNRTLTKSLAHRTIVDDASKAGVASADYVLIFRRNGTNPVPVAHPTGFTEYAGSDSLSAAAKSFRGWTGDQKANKYSHEVWQRYASSIWYDIRLDRTLPFQSTGDPDEEKHVHPLQLDVIDRVVQMRCNLGERVLTPFMGVGSEVVEAVRLDCYGIGIELKSSYYGQARMNLAHVDDKDAEEAEQIDLFGSEPDGTGLLDPVALQ
jgi:hypothetical protein